MSKSVLRILAIFIVGMVGGIFADQIFWPYFVEKPLFYEYRLEQSPVYVTEKKEISVTENVALQNAVEKVEKVIVGVRTETKGGEILEGSGLILTSDGLIATLADLIPVGADLSFFVEGKKRDYEILERDLKNNIALVKIEDGTLNTVEFADLENKKLGERVFVVGAIFDEEGNLSKIVNEGIIKYFKEDYVHTNIFESEVLSGSPLFDIEGRVLGLSQIDSQGKLVALPISLIREFSGL